MMNAVWWIWLSWMIPRNSLSERKYLFRGPDQFVADGSKSFISRSADAFPKPLLINFSLEPTLMMGNRVHSCTGVQTHFKA